MLNKKPKRIGLNLRITKKVQKRLKRLQILGDIPSTSEVVRRALAVYETLLEHYVTGGGIVLVSRDGKQEKYLVMEP